MNLLKPLPPIISKPVLPEPKVSLLGTELAYALVNGYRIQRGHNLVYKVYKDTYWGAFLKVEKRILAIYLNSTSGGPIRDSILYILYITEPPGVTIKVVFDRLNAILKYKNLPTLHLVGKAHWIFSDGRPWRGQRVFRIRENRRTEKAQLQQILEWHP